MQRTPTKYEIAHKELNLISNWQEIIKNWDELLRTQRKVIIRSLRLGIPSKYRGEIWALLTNAHKCKKESNFTYESLLTPTENPHTRIIDCDVPRTFPLLPPNSYPNFMTQLRRVLLAYSNIDTSLGYVQGMNFLAGMFLLYQDEETSFWSFYSLMHLSNNPHRDYFTDNFPRLRFMSEIVDRLVKEKFPETVEFYNDHSLTSLMFVPQWFNSCFISAEFNVEMNTFIYDQFLAFGSAPLLSFGLTIFSLHRQLLNKDMSEFLTVITRPGTSPIMHDRNTVNSEWVKQWISTKKLGRLIKEEEQRVEKEVIEQKNNGEILDEEKK